MARRWKIWLRRASIGELLVTGIRTEQCCETTTRHASDLGFEVRYVSDATLTFPMHTLRGARYRPPSCTNAPSSCSTAASRAWWRAPGLD